MDVPRFTTQEAQHYLAIEVIAGALMICFNALSQGKFSGGMAYFPFLMTFFLLSLLATIDPLATAVVYFGLIILVVLFLAPSPVADSVAGMLFFNSIAKASNDVATNGADEAQGYVGHGG